MIVEKYIYQFESECMYYQFKVHNLQNQLPKINSKLLPTYDTNNMIIIEAICHWFENKCVEYQLWSSESAKPTPNLLLTYYYILHM